MAIEKIVPDAVTTPNPAWTTNPHLQLDADDSNYATIAGANTGNTFIVSFGDLTSTIGSINSIRFYVNGFCGVVRGTTGVCSFDLMNASDSSYSLSENITFTSTISTIHSGTERTTSDGSTAWTESDVNGLRIKVGFSSITNSSATMNLDHLYIDVDYEEPTADTYDKLVQNLHITSGNVYLKSGNVYI